MMSSNLLPFFGKTKKSQGDGHVEYGGCGPTVAPFLARNYYGKKAE
jgi:hypothetical protein